MIKLLVYTAAIGGCGYAGYIYGKSVDSKAAKSTTTTVASATA